MSREMKKSLPMLFALAVLCITFSVASEVRAQSEPVAGAYGETSVTEPEVISAARYAVRTQSRRQGVSISLISVRKAEAQVVAGLNYRLGLRVNAGGRQQDVTAIVYKNLRRQYSLSSWEVSASSARVASPITTIKQLEESLSVAYMDRELGRLDSSRPYLGRVRIVVEHSLAGDDDKDRFEIKQFRTLAEAERWLRSREISEDNPIPLPIREVRPLIRCRNGVCTYNFDGGILHNHLYLKRISYAYRRGRPYIRTIYLLDGD